MPELAYPHGDALIPERFDEHTIVFLVRPPDAPAFSEEELDRLQVEHLTYLRDQMRQGLLVANGPVDDPSDARLRGISVYALPLADAMRVANDDPMVKAGRLAVEGARWLTAAGNVTFGSRPPGWPEL